MDGEGGGSAGGGDVGRATVDADGEGGVAGEPEELGEGSLVEEVEEVDGRCWRLGAMADEDDGVRLEAGGEEADVAGGEGLRRAAGVGVEEDVVGWDGAGRG